MLEKPEQERLFCLGNDAILPEGYFRKSEGFPAREKTRGIKEGPKMQMNAAQMAAKLLRDAAGFFRVVGEQTPSLTDAMGDNARIFEEVAALVESDPNQIVIDTDETANS